MDQWYRPLAIVRCACTEAETFGLQPDAQARYAYLRDFVLKSSDAWMKTVASYGEPDDSSESLEMHITDFLDSAEALQWILHGWDAAFWTQRDSRGRAYGLGDDTYDPGDTDAGSSSSEDVPNVDDLSTDLDSVENVPKERALGGKVEVDIDQSSVCEAFTIGRWVRLHGLQTEHLNGRIGEILELVNLSGRVGVRVQGDSANAKLIKLQNLHAFDDEEVVKITRIGAQGEQAEGIGSGGVRTWHWPRCVLDKLHAERCPIAELLGIPLRICKVDPHKALRGDDLDNHWATFIMMDPLTGVAPDKWQGCVGPVVLWRPGWEPFSAGDVCLLHSFISDLWEQYSHGPMKEDLQEYITNAALQQFKRGVLEEEQSEDAGWLRDDVNI